MKINPVHFNKLQKVYGDQAKKNNLNKNPKDDSIDISTKAKEIQQLEKTVQDKSDIRQEKVNQIKNAINQGTYEIDSEKVAEKILNDSQE